MRALFSFLGKILFLYLFIELIRWVWNSGTIGKLFLLTAGVISLIQYITK